MKRVITYGTYYVLHYGHVNLLKRARALGDYLIVALSSDEFNAIKKKKCTEVHASVLLGVRGAVFFRLEVVSFFNPNYLSLTRILRCSLSHQGEH